MQRLLRGHRNDLTSPNDAEKSPYTKAHRDSKGAAKSA